VEYSLVAGVIGKSKFIYDLWGDAVNIASRMESHGVAGQIHVSKEVCKRVKDRFSVEARGDIEIKGKGLMPTYLVHDNDSVTKHLSPVKKEVCRIACSD
jgi:class 3 adenylate cyclase